MVLRFLKVKTLPLNQSIQCSELSDTSSGLKDDQYFEWIISIFLLLLLIYLENRGYEISHRLNFKVNELNVNFEFKIYGSWGFL